MDFLTEEQSMGLRINQFIFHVVQQGEEYPKLLKETPLGKFEGFFLDIVRDTLKGNNFVFNQKSLTFKLLKEISDNPKKFVDNSIEIAKHFHSFKNKNIKPGVLIVMELLSGKTKYFSLIKYDHEQVLTYNLENNVRAILEEISNSFTKSKESIHKSALISLNTDGDGGKLIVIDKTVHYDITEFFKKFLNVKRKYTETEMTQNVNDAVISTAILHRDKIPPEITSRIRSTSFDAINKNQKFKQDDFFKEVFGPSGTPDIQKTFKKILNKKGIDESFKFKKDVISAPREKKYRTKEGVRIQYTSAAEKNVKIDYGDSKRPTTITITTQQLIEE